jgi:rhamnose transport system ATP-binding protein
MPTPSPEPSSGTPVLELRNVAKSFGAVVALSSGSLRADAGSIHALVGENGAGKSTLVKIVAGVHRRDAGEMLLGGVSVDFASTADSKHLGIAVIYQEPTLFPDLSVTENIFMGRQPVGAGRRIDRAAMYAEAESLFARLGVHIDPRRPAQGLSIADQQIIEIAKAISLDARVLIMDEPTAALGVREGTKVLQLIEGLKSRDLAIIVVSHNLEHVFAIADRIVVLRAGRVAGSRDKATSSHTDIVGMIMGAEPEAPA